MGETFLAPRKNKFTSSSRKSPTGLPADLLRQSAGRLRAIALLYAFVYFFAGFFPALLFPQERARLLENPSYWMPGATSIGWRWSSPPSLEANASRCRSSCQSDWHSKLVERLGQGGMGEVWRAKHRLLARPAAIKLIRPSLTAEGQSGVSEDAQRRFEREAQVIARLRSPHTVELFDFGIADDCSFYYVMELLDGLDADALVRRTGPLPAERVIHVIRQVCHSLSEAESCGLVHRDIKPANIFLCRYGEEYDFVKVLDFGIVKATRDTAETGAALTQDMSVHGTPAFIAPEQALGGSDLAGARTSMQPAAWPTGCSPGNSCSRATRRWRLCCTTLTRRQLRRRRTRNCRSLPPSMI